MVHVAEPTPSSAPRFRELAGQIGREVAAVHSDVVDRDARFPAEAISALRQARLLSAYVPRELGGAGCTVSDLIAMCEALGEHCASTAMIFAMHQIQVASLVHHGLQEPWFAQYLRRLSAAERLIASVTSEVGMGGSMRTSVCAVQREGPRIRLVKDATTISYGVQADDLLVTSRAHPAAAPGDQVLVLLQKDDFQLKNGGHWDTLGMRGTCSAGALVEGEAGADQVLATPFADISSQTMVPVSHLVWTSLWIGIASSAVARASRFVRAEARKKPGTTPPGALRLAEVYSELQAMRAGTAAMAAEYETLRSSTDGVAELTGIGFALRINNLKINASRAVTGIVHQALQICGIHGYKNDSPFTVGRLLRDAHSAALMVANDRIYATNASLLLVHKEA